MRADGAQAVSTQLLGRNALTRKGHAAASWGEPGAKVATDRAGANNGFT